MSTAETMCMSITASILAGLIATAATTTTAAPTAVIRYDSQAAHQKKGGQQPQQQQLEQQADTDVHAVLKRALAEPGGVRWPHARLMVRGPGGPSILLLTC